MKKYLILLLTLQSFLYSSEALTVGGQVVIDRAYFDDASGDATSDGDVRRARLFVKGYLSKSLKYEAEYSITGSNRWKDVYLEYQLLPDYFIKVGNIKKAIGLEALTSSKYNSFMERALTQTFMDKRKLGIEFKHPFKYNQHHYTLTVGAFGKSLDEWLESESSATSYVARTTYAHKWSKKTWLHLGLATQYNDYDEATLKLNTTPEADLFDRNLVSTKIKNVDTTHLWGLEAAMVWNAFSLQGEYFDMEVRNSSTDYKFKSGYLQMSYFLTGESKNYKVKKGTFSRIKPKSTFSPKGWGLGAWEVAARVSYLDIDDKDEQESIEKNYTLGVNWYATKNVRVMTNYVKATLSESDQDQDIVQFRVQYDF